jgi:hypothetical protein
MKKYVVFVLLLFSCKGTVPYSLGSDFCLDYDGNDYFAIYKSKNRWFVVDGEILEINRDSTFIITFTMPIEKIEKIEDPKQVLGYNEIREKIAKNPMREYWIINKKMKMESKLDKNDEYYFTNVFGPFNKEEYLKKRKELGVSDSLKLIPVMQFLGGD